MRNAAQMFAQHGHLHPELRHRARKLQTPQVVHHVLPIVHDFGFVECAIVGTVQAGRLRLLRHESGIGSIEGLNEENFSEHVVQVGSAVLRRREDDAMERGQWDYGSLQRVHGPSQVGIGEFGAPTEFALDLEQAVVFGQAFTSRQ